MKQNAAVAFLILVSCATALAQSKYNNQIQPGLSTRADVDKALGAPTRQLNTDLYEYPAPAGASQLKILYRTGTNLVELIELDFPETYTRVSMLQSLKLPQQADASTAHNGRLMEFFGGGKYLALVYAGGEAASGVNVLGYCSREYFERQVASISQQATAVGGAKPSLGGHAGAASASGPSTGTTTAQPNTGDFRVKLLTPISTETSKKGDKITAQVLEPDSFRGDVLEGSIQEAKSGGKINGKSVLNFSFTTLNHAGRAVPVEADVKSVVNSKGQQNVDEEGSVIRKKNNLGKIAVGTALGALIGGLAGGGRGAAIGAGAGAATSVILVEVAADGANVSFAPGSEFVVSLKAASRASP